MLRTFGPIFSTAALLCLLNVWGAHAAAQDDTRTPSENTTELPAEDAVRIKGNAGGSVRATQYGVSPSGPCMGWIPTDAQHEIVVRTRTKVRIAVHSTADTTLILVGPKETKKPFVRCSDDVGDSNDPELHETLEPGRYKIYVGTWNAGSRVPFSMRLESSTDT